MVAIGALADFTYEKLEVDVTYDTDGTLTLGIRLEGSNSAVESGRPIHYNLNITENLPALLQSLQLSDELSERVEQGLTE